MPVKDYAAQQLDYVTRVRQHLHAHPEISLKEFKTARFVEGELDKFGIAHERVGETGICAILRGTKLADGKTKTVALRADMDALGMQDLNTAVPYHSQNEGLCHACGHDGHTASLLAAAKILKARQHEFSGEIRFFFQQAEEIGQGARQFVKAGLLNGVDRIYGAHVASYIKLGEVGLRVGEQCASCDYFKITIKGRGAHVSKPHMSVDAALVAAHTMVALQSIVARNTNPLDTVVVGVGVINAGTQYNVIAENATLEGTTRSFNPVTRKATNDKVIEIAQKTAELFGATASVEFRDYAAPLLNDKTVTEEVRAVAENIVGKEGVIEMSKSLGADDFADYLAVTPGCYAYVGIHSDKPNTGIAHHHGLFDMDERALVISCNLYVDYALSVLAR